MGLFNKNNLFIKFIASFEILWFSFIIYLKKKFKLSLVVIKVTKEGSMSNNYLKILRQKEFNTESLLFFIHNNKFFMNDYVANT